MDGTKGSVQVKEFTEIFGTSDSDDGAPFCHERLPKEAGERRRGCCKIFCCAVLFSFSLFVAMAAPCLLSPLASQVSRELIESELGGSAVYTHKNLSSPQLGKVRRDVQAISGGSFLVEGSNFTFASASASEIADLVYNATRISGVWEHVPQKLRGVFWMRGNPSGAELVALQYGTWFQQEQTYLSPVLPFSSAWASRAPAKAMLGEGLASATWSYVVRACPRGRVCPAGSVEGTYATLQLHRGGNLMEDSTNAHSLWPGFPSIFKHLTAKFELEEQVYSPQPGSLWKRPCWWGIGTCRLLEVGSYDLVKIIDGDGRPLEPGYSDFKAYIGDRPLSVWTGKGGTQS